MKLLYRLGLSIEKRADQAVSPFWCSMEEKVQ